MEQVVNRNAVADVPRSSLTVDLPDDPVALAIISGLTVTREPGVVMHLLNAYVYNYEVQRMREEVERNTVELDERCGTDQFRAVLQAMRGGRPVESVVTAPSEPVAADPEPESCDPTPTPREAAEAAERARIDAEKARLRQLLSDTKQSTDRLMRYTGRLSGGSLRQTDQQIRDEVARTVDRVRRMGDGDRAAYQPQPRNTHEDEVEAVCTDCGGCGSYAVQPAAPVDPLTAVDDNPWPGREQLEHMKESL